MKTTVKVSISGIAFNMDEDAYIALNNYLNTLKAHFNRKEGGKEVVDDIEARMAELLSMRVSSPIHVITLADAQEVIRIMGKPSDLFEEEHEPDKKDKTPQQTVTIHKRLYRDVENGVAGGVCSGLGNYFNIDPVIIRILFVIATIGIGIIPFSHSGFGTFPLQGIAIWVYIILWIALPKAVTTKQKLEMKGKNPSIDDIEQKVLYEQQRVSEYENHHTKSPVLNFFGLILRIFVMFIAGILVFSGAVALIAIVAAFVGLGYGNGFGINDAFDIVGADSFFVRLLLAITVIYPFFMLTYWGSKLIFRFKLRDKAIMILAFVIWLFSVIAICTYGAATFWQEHDARQTNMEKMETIPIRTTSDTLYVNLAEIYQQSADTPIGELKTNEPENPRIWIDDYDGLKTLFVVPEIKIRYSSTISDYQMDIRKKAYGRNKREAERYVERSKLKYTQKDSLLLISPLMFNKDYPLRNSREYFDIVISAPEGKKVIIQQPLLSKSTMDSESYSWSFTWGSRNGLW